MHGAKALCILFFAAIDLQTFLDHARYFLSKKKVCFFCIVFNLHYLCMQL